MFIGQFLKGIAWDQHQKCKMPVGTNVVVFYDLFLH